MFFGGWQAVKWLKERMVTMKLRKNPENNPQISDGRRQGDLPAFGLRVRSCASLFPKPHTSRASGTATDLLPPTAPTNTSNRLILVSQSMQEK